MRTFIIIAASALLLAAIIAELSSRLWPGSELAILILAALALLTQGYLSLKFAPSASAPKPRSADNRRARADSGATRGQSGAPKAPRESGGKRESGTVKWFNRTKGFGFIVRESGEEIFVHQRSIRTAEGNDGRRRPSLKDGQDVTFTVANREKGLQAEDVAPA